MIRVNNIKFNYNNDLTNECFYTFQMPLQKNIGIFGMNGSGKTTLFLLMAGLLTPTSGSLYVSDKEITHFQPSDRNISILFQNYNLFDHLTIESNLKLIATLNKRNILEKLKYYMYMFDIYSLRKKKPYEISGGERQRVNLVRILIESKTILLLDEPFSALDPAHSTSIMKLLMQEVVKNAQTLFIISHKPFEIREYVEYAIFVHQNRIHYYGPMEEFLKSNNDTIKLYLSSR